MKNQLEILKHLKNRTVLIYIAIVVLAPLLITNVVTHELLQKILEIAASYAIPISFASDTHNINTVAYKFEELAHFARQFGYKEHTVFINRQPIQLAF